MTETDWATDMDIIQVGAISEIGGRLKVKLEYLGLLKKGVENQINESERLKEKIKEGDPYDSWTHCLCSTKEEYARLAGSYNKFLDELKEGASVLGQRIYLFNKYRSDKLVNVIKHSFNRINGICEEVNALEPYELKLE